jgi:hypothetical protein
MEKRMTFEEIVDGGYVVAADDWLNMLVVWNGSGTFNVWSLADENVYRNVDCFTRYNVSHPHQAKTVANKWLANIYDQMETYHEAA